jgi:hypothetical protein
MAVHVNLASHALYQVCPGTQRMGYARAAELPAKPAFSVCLWSPVGRAEIVQNPVPGTVFSYSLFFEASSNAFPLGAWPRIQDSVYIDESKTVCCVCRSPDLGYGSFRAF